LGRKAVLAARRGLAVKKRRPRRRKRSHRGACHACCSPECFPVTLEFNIKHFPLFSNSVKNLKIKKKKNKKRLSSSFAPGKNFFFCLQFFFKKKCLAGSCEGCL
jgi:hypothetical protein